MAAVKRVEDLEIWKLAREISGDLCRLVNTTKLKNDFVMRDQISKSSVSINSNIAEEFEIKRSKRTYSFLKYS